MHTLTHAVDAVRRNGRDAPIVSSRVVETATWWFLPITAIGCAGYIVDKSDLAVDELGSGLPLDLWFWAHDHGIVSSPVDFTVTDEVDSDVIVLRDIVSRFHRRVVRADGSVGYTWYFQHEIDRAIATQFPTFHLHIVTSAITQIKSAVEGSELSFVCVRSQEQNQPPQDNALDHT